MNRERLIENMIGQIKEAQIKLGYTKETIRLYYTIPSLNAILGVNCKDADEIIQCLKQEFEEEKGKLGDLRFSVHCGRIEVSIPPEGVTYVHEHVKSEPFLIDMIELFQMNHHCGLDEICSIFEKYSKDYVCEPMGENMDFDYAIYFSDPKMDAYIYCIKMEMGHTIYHRFTKEDYEMIKNA